MESSKPDEAPLTPATLSFVAPDESALLEFAARVAKVSPPGLVFYLHGELGAGKTAFTRGFLHALGVPGKVKSPTFTLVEPYIFNGGRAYHFDLYRLAAPEELELIGVRDYFAHQAFILVEWPERGQGILPEPDVHVYLAYALPGRALRLEAVSARASALIAALQSSVLS